jgi:hypothetical protein
MFVTLARHYAYKPVYAKGGDKPINEPSKCAAWAIKNNIDVAAQSIAKTSPKKAGNYKRLGVQRALSTLLGAGVMTEKHAEMFSKKIEELYPQLSLDDVEFPPELQGDDVIDDEAESDTEYDDNLYPIKK